jgi:hypothetical protein
MAKGLPPLKVKPTCTHVRQIGNTPVNRSDRAAERNFPLADPPGGRLLISFGVSPSRRSSTTNRTRLGVRQPSTAETMFDNGTLPPSSQKQSE